MTFGGVQTLAPLYPKCALSQTTRSQRSISNELHYNAKQDLISVSKKITDDILAI